MQFKRKNPITLLEIMIVIFLIALIGGAVGYNMKGSLEKGKAFRTEEAQRRIKDILLMVASEREISLDVIVEKPEKYLKLSGLVKDPNKLMRDGWGEMFILKVDENGDEITVHSEKLVQYRRKQKGIESSGN
jgi:hypothetical protein